MWLHALSISFLLVLEEAVWCGGYLLFLAAGIVTKICYKIAETLNNVTEERKGGEEDGEGETDGGDTDGVITVQILSEFGE